MELLDFPVPEVVSDELDLTPVVFFLTFGFRYDLQKFPIGVVDGVFEFTLEICSAGFGVGGFDEEVDETKEECTIA